MSLPEPNMMRMGARVRLCVLLALGCAWLGGAAKLAAADLATLLPPDTLVMVQAPSAQALIKAFEASAPGGFWNDPRSEEFFEPLRERLAELRAELLREKDLPAGSLAQFCSGTVAVAALPTDREARSPMSWVLLVEHNGAPAVIERIKQGPRLKDTSVLREERDQAGLPFTTLRISKEEAATIPATQKQHPAGEKHGVTESVPGALDVRKKKTRSYDQYVGEGLFIHAERTAEPIRRVLDRVASKGAGDSLATQPYTKQLREHLGKQAGAGPLEIYINFAALAPIIERESGKDLEDYGGSLKALKLGELRTLGGRLAFEGKRTNFTMVGLAPEPRTGVMRALYLGSTTPAAVAPLLPADALSFSATQGSLPQLWPVLWQAFGGTVPTIQAMVALQLQAMSQAGVDLERDLIALLGDTYGHYQLPPAAEGDRRRGSARPATTWLFELTDAKRFDSLLNAALNHGQQTLGLYNIERTLLHERPLYAIRQGALNPQGLTQRTSGEPLFYLCVTPQWLLAGPQVQPMEAVVKQMASGDEGLAGGAAFKRVAAAWPAARTGEGYADLPGFWRAWGKVIMQPLERGIGKKKGRGGLLDDGEMPAAEVFAEYFGPLGATRNVAGEAWRADLFLLPAKP